MLRTLSAAARNGQRNVPRSMRRTIVPYGWKPMRTLPGGRNQSQGIADVARHRRVVRSEEREDRNAQQDTASGCACQAGAVPHFS
jgi:hypothetical protein